MYQSNVYESRSDGLQAYITKVFTKMAGGLGVTALVAYLGYRSLISRGLVYKMMGSGRGFLFVIFAIQIGLVVSLTRSINEMNPSRANAMFYLYSAITGITFSYLPLAFGKATVFQAFALSAVMFGSCAVIGSTTKVDLTKFSGLLYGGVIALCVAGLLSFWFPIFAGTGISFFGVFVFLGLTAYDMQKLKGFYYQTNGFDGANETLAIYGAFSLYLDFINIFLYVLRIMGNSRD